MYLYNHVNLFSGCDSNVKVVNTRQSSVPECSQVLGVCHGRVKVAGPGDVDVVADAALDAALVGRTGTCRRHRTSTNTLTIIVNVRTSNNDTDKTITNWC